MSAKANKKISSLAVACPGCGIPLGCPECGHIHPPVGSLTLEHSAPAYRTGFIVMTTLFVFLLLGLILFAFDGTSEVSDIAAQGEALAATENSQGSTVVATAS